MKNSKKSKPRPRWQCPKCGSVWVSGEKKYIDCVVCDIAGTPLNEGAEKILKKVRSDSYE